MNDAPHGDSVRAASPWRKLFDRHPVAMWVVDARTQAFVDVNDAALALYGYTRAHFLQLTLAVMGQGGDPGATARLPMPSGGADAGVVVEHRRADGTRFDVELHTVPIELDAAPAVAVIARPVDDAHALALALREVRERFDLAARATTDVVYDWNVPAGVLWWNENLHRVLGHDERLRHTGLDWWAERLHPADRERVESSLDRSIAQGRPVWTAEYRVRRGDGTWATVLDRGYVVFDAEGHPLRMIGAMEDITERREAEEALRRSEERFRAFIERSSDLLMVLDPTLRVGFCSPSVEEACGFRPVEVIGRSLAEQLHPEDVDRVMGLLRDLARLPGAAARFDARFGHRDGTWRTFESVARNLCHVPAVAGLVVNSRDLTERQRLEHQLLQVQKLDAVGQLAGGIAHDFNNLLMAIGGYAEMVADRLGEAHPVVPDLEHIKQAAARAGALTKQLLAFGRKTPAAPAVVDLAAVVRNAHHLLDRLIGEDIELRAETAPDLWLVRVDPHQLEQVLINLAVNSRDAMPTGGNLTLHADNVRAPGLAGEPGPTSGEWVRLVVTDTGTGMDQATRAHAFEPFFTTKPPGKGTGLGLATCQSIVTRYQGHIHLESVVGAGTTVRVYLPRATGGIAAERPAASPDTETAGAETILVVEDETLVRQLAVRALRARGYFVIEAANGLAAIEAARTFDGPIDLVVTDVVMPQLSGAQTARRLQEARPGLPVIFTSGYTDDALLRHGVAGSEVDLLPKPYTPSSLAAKVREVLDRPLGRGPK